MTMTSSPPRQRRRQVRPWSVLLIVGTTAVATQTTTRSSSSTSVLSSLLGPIPGKKAFFRDYFQQKPTVIRRHNPTFYHPVMQPGEVDHVLVQSITATLLEDLNGKANKTQAEAKAKKEEWKLVKRAKHPNNNGEWWSASPAHNAKGKALLGLSEDASELDMAHAAFAHGFSLVINGVEEKADGPARLAQAFEEELGYRTGINLYFTPDRSQGFEAHFDWMDAFVLQVDGSKRWRLYDAMVEQPRPDMRVKPSATELGEPFIDFVLEAGDLLYLPSGLIHEALTELEEEDVSDRINNIKGVGGPSLHLTVGVETTVLGSWESLLLEVLVEATEGGSPMSTLVCLGGTGDTNPNLGNVLSAPVALLGDDQEEVVVKVGDLLVLALVQVASQERALRRAVPLTPLMKQGIEMGTSSSLPKQLGELATLFTKEADIETALATLVNQHKGVLPRSLSASGNKGDGAQVEARLAALLATQGSKKRGLPDAVKRTFASACQCSEHALHNTTQAEVVLAQFESKCQQDLQERQAERKAKLGKGVWQATIPAADGVAEIPPQIYGVGMQSSS